MKPTIDDLLRIMATLRDPDRGCPWDREQDFDTIAPYTIEEAYEVADAIDRRDYAALCEELGDLLLQVVFHARMAEEAGHFDFGDVVAAISRKMVTRHPHVFADASFESVESRPRRGNRSSPPSARRKAMPTPARSPESRAVCPSGSAH